MPRGISDAVDGRAWACASITLHACSCLPFKTLWHLTGRKKVDKSLFTMQQADEVPGEPFVKEMESALRAHELVSAREGGRVVERARRRTLSLDQRIQES